MLGKILYENAVKPRPLFIYKAFDTANSDLNFVQYDLAPGYNFVLRKITHSFFFAMKIPSGNNKINGLYLELKKVSSGVVLQNELYDLKLISDQNSGVNINSVPSEPIKNQIILDQLYYYGESFRADFKHVEKNNRHNYIVVMVLFHGYLVPDEGLEAWTGGVR